MAKASKNSSSPSFKPEVITVDDDSDTVSCDGGGGALGHPLVYYSFNGAEHTECGYCDRIFVRKRAAKSFKA
jgi:uncharacterized Zn-finger protein